MRVIAPILLAVMVAFPALALSETVKSGAWTAKCAVDKLTDKKQCTYEVKVKAGNSHIDLLLGMAEAIVSGPSGIIGGGIRAEDMEAAMCSGTTFKGVSMCSFTSGTRYKGLAMARVHNTLFFGSKVLVVLKTGRTDIETTLDATPYRKLIEKTNTSAILPDKCRGKPNDYGCLVGPGGTDP